LKSVKAIVPVHQKQVLTCLRLTNLKFGLLINFGEALIKDGISRVANGLAQSFPFAPLRLCVTLPHEFETNPPAFAYHGGGGNHPALRPSVAVCR
jgi:hypothetical protein